MDHYISSADDLALLRRTLDDLLALKAKNGRIANSPWTLSGIHDFFLHGTIPGCKAGRRFMVVTPTGGLRAVLDVREYLHLAQGNPEGMGAQERMRRVLRFHSLLPRRFLLDAAEGQPFQPGLHQSAHAKQC